jgi:hypothetical protein
MVAMILPSGRPKNAVPAFWQQLKDLSPSQQYLPSGHLSTASFPAAVKSRQVVSRSLRDVQTSHYGNLLLLFVGALVQKFGHPLAFHVLSEQV